MDKILKSCVSICIIYKQNVLLKKIYIKYTDNIYGTFNPMVFEKLYAWGRSSAALSLNFICIHQEFHLDKVYTEGKSKSGCKIILYLLDSRLCKQKFITFLLDNPLLIPKLFFI